MKPNEQRDGFAKPFIVNIRGFDGVIEVRVSDPHLLTSFHIGDCEVIQD